MLSLYVFSQETDHFYTFFLIKRIISIRFFSRNGSFLYVFSQETDHFCTFFLMKRITSVRFSQETDHFYTFFPINGPFLNVFSFETDQFCAFFLMKKQRIRQKCSWIEILWYFKEIIKLPDPKLLTSSIFWKGKKNAKRFRCFGCFNCLLEMRVLKKNITHFIRLCGNPFELGQCGDPGIIHDSPQVYREKSSALSPRSCNELWIVYIS